VTGGAGFIGSHIVRALIGARRTACVCSTISRPAAARTSLKSWLTSSFWKAMCVTKTPSRGRSPVWTPFSRGGLPSVAFLRAAGSG